MKNILKTVLVVLVVIGVYVASTASTITVSGDSSRAVDKYSGGTYASSQVDTVKYVLGKGVGNLSFIVQHGDSVTISKVIVRRVYNGVQSAVIAGDTLYTSYQTTASGVKMATITLNPRPESFWVYVTYADSANGVTSPTVGYAFAKNYTE